MSYRAKRLALAGSESPPQPTARRRKRLSRVDSESEAEEEFHHQVSPTNSPERPRFHRSLSSKSVDEDYPVQIEDEEEYNELDDDTKGMGRSKGRSLTDSQPPRKRARTAQSSPESEEEYMDEDVNVSDMDIGGDDDFVVDDEPAGKKGKSRAGRGGNKRKGKLDGSAHKKAPGEKPRGADATSGTKRPRPSLKPEDSIVDVVGDVTGTPDPGPSMARGSPSAQAKDGSPVPPIPKKRKLPTIKKNKSSASGGSGTPSSLAASTPKPSASGTPQQKSVLPDAGNKGGRAAALGGNTDLDLTDKSVYAELFKGGSSQRNASTRRTKEEERRRELDKMRDDARAKREEEAKQSFDLQAQYEKISKFEERLRQDKNPVLYPNQLGIKLRVQWDMEHMARKERRGQENGDLNGREEGEMNESPMRR